MCKVSNVSINPSTIVSVVLMTAVTVNRARMASWLLVPTNIRIREKRKEGLYFYL